MRFDFGSPVACAGEAYGELADLVIDPDRRCVTHLVVQPPHGHSSARLVPIERARAREGPERSTIFLDCSVAEISQMEPVRRSAYLRLGEHPVEGPDSDVGIEKAVELLPAQSLGVDALGSGIGPMDYDPHATVSYDRIPTGMVEIRQASELTSSDGRRVGHVIGLVVGERNQIAQLVLEHGHLWGKREITIPIDSVDCIRSDEVVLTLSGDELLG